MFLVLLCLGVCLLLSLLNSLYLTTHKCSYSSSALPFHQWRCEQVDLGGALLLAGVKPEPESKSVSSRPSSRHPNCRFPSFLSALLILQINYVCSISRKFFTLLPLHFKIYMQRCQVLHARSKNVKLKCFLITELAVSTASYSLKLFTNTVW